MASASNPIRMSSVTMSMPRALLPDLPLFQRLDFFLDLFLGGAGPDRTCDAADVPCPQFGERVEEHEQREASDPDELRNHRWNLQIRLAAGARGPGLHDHSAAMPRHQTEEAGKQQDAREVEGHAQPGRKQEVKRVDADVRAVEERCPEPPGRSDGQSIAGELVGAANGADEELAQDDVDADQQCRCENQRTPEPETPLCEATHRRSVACAQLAGAVSPSTLPTVSFHSLAHSAPQRLAQPASTALSTSFLCASRSPGLTGTSWILASLPSVQGCLPVLQLSASAVAFFSVSHILFS